MLLYIYGKLFHVPRYPGSFPPPKKRMGSIFLRGIRFFFEPQDRIFIQFLLDHPFSKGIEFSLNLKFNSDLVDLPDLLDLLDLSDLSDLSPIRSAIFRKK